jgi:predicted DsbA family dithiol-disulfide isomerase
MDVFSRRNTNGPDGKARRGATEQELFDVEWRPFQIDTGTNINGERVQDYCNRRWGGSGWTNHLKSEGRKDGATFNDWQWWPATSKAHQLVKFCSSSSSSSSTTSSAQSPYCSSDHINALLFEAEYERGENISLVDVLVEIGRRAGVPGTKVDELRQYLLNNKGKDNVDSEIQDGRRKYGISGVPFFIVSSQDNDDTTTKRRRRPYGFAGAQSTETFLDIFEELSSSNDGPN